MPLLTNFSSSPRRQLIRFALIISGLICVVFGLLRSLDSLSDQTLWVIDNSLSMAVTDVSSQDGVFLSRLDQAKQIVASGSSMRSGEQGIMTAAGGARLEMAMTGDRGVFTDTVRGITVQDRGGGSSVSTPLEMIRLVYGNMPHLQIVWITDGEFSDVTEQSSLLPLTGGLEKVSITMIGVGTRTGGPILLGYDSDGRPRYKESDGKRINSIRDDDRLVSVADALDAELILADSDISPITRHIAKIPNPNTMPPYLTILGVFLIVVGLMVPRFRYMSNHLVTAGHPSRGEFPKI